MLAVVCDSSPLVYLSKLNQFQILEQIYDSVLVPPAVWREVAVGGEGLPESANLKAAVAQGWVKVETPSPLEAIQLSAELGKGETQAILLAKERGAVLVTDDGLGRSAAESIGVEVTGTIGVLIKGKRTGRISAIRPLVDSLRQETNFRMTDKLYRDALAQAGEPQS
ncbi:MAG: DUF3368 domain-containing protein [Verrucomicrobiota bacterium]